MLNPANFCFPNHGSLISLADVRLLASCCERCEAKAILEIGTKAGGSAIVLAKSVEKRGGRVYCIDPIQHSRLEGNLESHGVEHLVEFILGRSPWVGSEIVPDVLDMLWIDGDHSFLGALADFIYWEPRVRSGGVIAFHDYSERLVWHESEAIELAVNLIVRERSDLTEIDFVGIPDGGTIAFQKGAQVT